MPLSQASRQKALESRILSSMTKSSRAKKAGRAIPDGPKMQIKWDFLDNNDYLTGQHNYDDISAAQAEVAATAQLAKLEAEGRKSRAARMRKEINLATEARWAVRSSWCPTCVQLFHNCKCPPPEMPNKVGEDGVQLILRLRQEEVDRRRNEKAREKRERRVQFRLEKKQRG